MSDPVPPVATCDHCPAPATYVHVSYREIHQYREDMAAWKAANTAKNQAQAARDGRVANSIELDMISGAELFSIPRSARWRRTCDEHFPKDENPYGLPYPKTWREWVHITAHLLESKDWLSDTNWDDVLYTTGA